MSLDESRKALDSEKVYSRLLVSDAGRNGRTYSGWPAKNLGITRNYILVVTETRGCSSDRTFAKAYRCAHFKFLHQVIRCPFRLLGSNPSPAHAGVGAVAGCPVQLENKSQGACAAVAGPLSQAEMHPARTAIQGQNPKRLSRLITLCLLTPSSN